MPNWCENIIEISGNSSRVEAIRKKLQGFSKEDMLFEGLISDRISPNNDTENTDIPEWYRDNVHNFGTKWDVRFDDCKVEYEGDNIKIQLDTAWSPPNDFCKNLRNKHLVTVKCTFYELGMDFCGYHIYSADGTKECKEYKYMPGLYLINRPRFWIEFTESINRNYEHYEDEIYMVIIETDSEDDKDSDHDRVPEDNYKPVDIKQLIGEKYREFMQPYTFILNNDDRMLSREKWDQAFSKFIN